MRLQLATFSLLASFAIAQEAGQAPEPTKVVSGSMGIDFTSAYYFRGIFQENQSAIAQPWLELAYGLGDAGDSVKGVNLTLGMWNSLHDGPSGTGGGAQSMWYENDFYAGLSATVADKWSVGATYTNYYSPNARFGTVQELGFSVGFDDKGLMSEGFSGLQPSLTVAFELAGQADAGADRGIYAQIGVEPTFAAGKLGEADVTVSVPVTVGLSIADYYEFGTGNNDTLGYVDVGVAASAPVTFLPSRFGPWEATLGLHLLLLGDNNELVNGNDGSELIVSFGLSTTF